MEVRNSSNRVCCHMLCKKIQIQISYLTLGTKLCNQNIQSNFGHCNHHKTQRHKLHMVCDLLRLLFLVSLLDFLDFAFFFSSIWYHVFRHCFSFDYFCLFFKSCYLILSFSSLLPDSFIFFLIVCFCFLQFCLVCLSWSQQKYLFWFSWLLFLVSCF